MSHKLVDVHHHCHGFRYGRGVDRGHAAVARCLADVIRSHSGTKVYIEQTMPGLSRVVNGQFEHASTDGQESREDQVRVPFVLETTGRPGYHAKKFIGSLMKDADQPSLAIRDTRSAIQSVLRSAISKQQLTAAAT